MTLSQISQQIKTHLQDRLPFYLQLLQRMVAINSFTSNPTGVNELGQVTAEIFADLGFTAEMVPSVHHMFGHHLVLTREGRGKNGRSAPKIGMVSHLDTVFPPDEEVRNQFHWREVGDKIYGPGTVDIKGGTVLMYMMLDALRAVVPDVYEHTTWILLLDASEEVDGSDFSELCVDRLGKGVRACLVFEGGFVSGPENWIVVARKGMATYRVTVEGRAAHAGSAHRHGANAVVQMAEIIQRISNMTDYERALTFNVGTVAGGTVTNRVPHFASAHVEMRAFSPVVYEEAMAQMLALRQYSTIHSANGNFACRVQVEVTRRTEPWPRNPETDRLLVCWQKAAKLLGMKIVPEERGGLSDGNYFWDRIPTIDGLGPAGGNSHCSEQSEDGSKEQEYCLPGSFVPKALLNTTAVLHLLSFDEDAKRVSQRAIENDNDR